MPIDFTQIANDWRAPLVEQAKGIDARFLALSRALAKLAERARAAEAATRGMPVWEFTDNALHVKVRASRWSLPALRTDGIGSTLLHGGAEFLRGLATIGTMAEAEIAIPRLLGAVEDLSAAFVEPMRRFQHATPELFDPSQRTLFDIPAIAGIGLRRWSPTCTASRTSLGTSCSGASGSRWRSTVPVPAVARRRTSRSATGCRSSSGSKSRSFCSFLPCPACSRSRSKT
jgi:hypothetical protein